MYPACSRSLKSSSMMLTSSRFWVSDRTFDFLHYRFRIFQQADNVIAVIVRLGHLLGRLQQRHYARARFRNKRLRHLKDIAIQRVETLGDIAAQFQVLFLVFTHRYQISLIQQDVRRHQHRISENIKKLAHTYTQKLAPLQFLKTDHDIGFQLFCSYGNGYRLTGNKEYLNILHNGAMSLATRFNPIIGSIRSWDSSRDKWKFPVIIDNMMNLELLMWVGNQYNDPYLKTVAITRSEEHTLNSSHPSRSRMPSSA